MESILADLPAIRTPMPRPDDEAAAAAFVPGAPRKSVAARNACNACNASVARKVRRKLEF